MRSFPAPVANDGSPKSVRTKGTAQTYFAATRAPRYSLLFALPLLVFYETLALLINHSPVAGVRNMGDVLLKALFISLAGRNGLLLFQLCLIGGSVLLIARDARRHGLALRSRYFAGMLAESIVLAGMFGLVVGTITAQLLGSLGALSVVQGAVSPVQGMDWWTRVMSSLGAGLYEELLFRVLLAGALAAGARSMLGLSVRGAGVLATIVSAFIFSAAHYVGVYGDTLTMQSFVFRFISGIFFSGLYLLRGFGITAWTHALYDVFVLAL